MNRNFSKSIIAFTIILFFIHVDVLAQDKQKIAEILKPLLYSDDPLNANQERELAEYLFEGTNTYIKMLKEINFLTFKNRNDIPADLAVSLKTEANDLVTAFEDMVKILNKPIKSPDVYTVLSWTIVARQIAVNKGRMEDLEKWEILNSDWPTFLSIILPSIFDQILAPKIFELAKYRLKTEKVNK